MKRFLSILIIFTMLLSPASVFAAGGFGTPLKNLPALPDRPALDPGTYVEGDVIVTVRPNYGAAAMALSDDDLYDMPQPSPFRDLLYGEDTELLLMRGEDAMLMALDEGEENFAAEADPLEAILYIHSDSMSTAELIEGLSELPEVYCAEPNYIVSLNEVSSGTSSEESDPKPDVVLVFDDYTSDYRNSCIYSIEWPYSVQLPSWNNPEKKNAEGVVVAVLDTGADYNHPDLKNVMWKDTDGLLSYLGGGLYGYNTQAFNNPRSSIADPMDGDGHGTHVSGIIAAEWNDFGISGGANGAQIMAVKVLDDKGDGSILDVVRGIRYVIAAIDSGVNVRAVNCSIATSTITYCIEAAIDELVKRNAVFVKSAGNESHYAGEDENAAFKYMPGTIVVGASDYEGNCTFFSNYGHDIVDVFAPGSAVFSLSPLSLAGSDRDIIPGRALPIREMDADGSYINMELSPGVTAIEDDNGILYMIPDTKDTYDIILKDPENYEDEAAKANSRYFAMEYVYINPYGTQYVQLDIPCIEVTEGADSTEVRLIPFELDDSGLFFIDLQSDFVMMDEEGNERTYRPVYYDYPGIRISFCNDPDPWMDFFGIISANMVKGLLPFKELSGTSQAAPVVSACAAIAAAKFPEESAEKIAARVCGSVTPMDGLADLCISGGIVNAAKLLEGDTIPVLNKVSKNGAEYTLDGYFFGDAEGCLTIDESLCSIEAWSDTQIVFTLDGDYETGNYLFEVTTAEDGDTAAKSGHKFVSMEGRNAYIEDRLPLPSAQFDFNAAQHYGLVASGTSDNPEIYVPLSNKGLMSVFAYDGSWRELCSLPELYLTAQYNSAVSKDGLLYVFTLEKVGYTYKFTAVQINPEDGSYVVKTLPVNYEKFAVAAAGDNFLLAGGNMSGRRTRSVYTYDFDANELTLTENKLPKACTNARIFLKDDYAYLAGGQDIDGSLHELYRMPLSMEGGMPVFGDAELLYTLDGNIGYSTTNYVLADSGLLVLGADEYDKDGGWHDMLVYDFEKETFCYTDKLLAASPLVRNMAGSIGDTVYLFISANEIEMGSMFAKFDYGSLTLTPVNAEEDPEEPDEPVIPDEPAKPSRPHRKPPAAEEPESPAPPKEEHVYAAQFKDVSDTSYYAEAVNWAAAKGITSGISSTEFGPDMLCTRGQMMTFLWTLAGRSVVNYAMQFKDIDADAYYSEAVRWAVSEGITSGKNAAEFAPGDYCTRAQAVTFLWLMAGKPEADKSMQFADVKEDSYYAKAVRWAESVGITSGVGSNNFGPERNCTRAQMVTFLYSYSKLQIN